MQHLKLLKTYTTEFEAELIRTKLEREGIEAMISSEDHSNILPSLDYTNGHHVLVEPEDLERAMSLLETADDDLTDDMDTTDATGLSEA